MTKKKRVSPTVTVALTISEVLLVRDAIAEAVRLAPYPRDPRKTKRLVDIAEHKLLPLILGPVPGRDS